MNSVCPPNREPWAKITPPASGCRLTTAWTGSTTSGRAASGSRYRPDLSTGGSPGRVRKVARWTGYTPRHGGRGQDRSGHRQRSHDCGGPRSFLTPLPAHLPPRCSPLPPRRWPIRPTASVGPPNPRNENIVDSDKVYDETYDNTGGCAGSTDTGRRGAT